MRYRLTFEDIATSAVIDEFKTLAAIVVPNTTGIQARLRQVRLGPSDDIPEDRNVSVQVGLIDLTPGGHDAGTPTTVLAGADMFQANPRSPVSAVTGGIGYGGANEPKIYDVIPFCLEDSFNLRGGFIHTWWDEDEMPEIPQNFALGLLVAPKAAIQVRLSGSIAYEVY